MKIYDVSMPIHSSMLTWPGDPGVQIEQKTTVAKDGVRLSMLSLSTHTGTHVDAPNHFIENGSGIDSINPRKLYGPCEVLDLTNNGHPEILPSHLEGAKLEKGSRILLKTGNYKFLRGSKFPNRYISLSLAGAKYLVQKGVYLVGIDFLGIEKSKNPGHPVHTTLLKAGIVNVEGLELGKVPAGTYTIICMPLRIVDADGSPARVILIKDKG